MAYNSLSIIPLVSKIQKTFQHSQSIPYLPKYSLRIERLSRYEDTHHRRDKQCASAGELADSEVVTLSHCEKKKINPNQFTGVTSAASRVHNRLRIHVGKSDLFRG